MGFRAVLLGLWVGAFAPAMASGAEPDVEALLTKMREAYKTAKTARLEVDIKLTGPEDKEINGSATVNYKAQKNARVVLKLSTGDSEEDAPITYVSDGKKMTVFATDEKRATTDYDEDEFPLPLNLETLCFWMYDKQLSTKDGANMNKSDLKIVTNVDWNGKKWTTLEETAKENKVFVRYYIDPKSNLIWRCEVKELDSLRPMIDVTATKLETDVELSDELFKIDG